MCLYCLYFFVMYSFLQNMSHVLCFVYMCTYRPRRLKWVPGDFVSQAAPFASRFAHVESLCLRFDYCFFALFASCCELHARGVWEPSPWTAGSMGSLALLARKCRGSRFEQLKLCELSLWMLEIMGAFTLNDQKCGGSRFKCSKVSELSLKKVQKWKSSDFKRQEMWELSL